MALALRRRSSVLDLTSSRRMVCSGMLIAAVALIVAALAAGIRAQARNDSDRHQRAVSFLRHA